MWRDSRYRYELMADEQVTAESPAWTARASLLQRGGRFAFPVPDALMAVLFALAALPDLLTPEQLTAVPPSVLAARDELVFGLVAEGGFLMMQGTLIDIATRLKKRPPIWVIPIIMAAVVLFSEYAMSILRLAWERGAVVFVPLLFSLGERATVLWRLPGLTRVQKIAARALVSNRITTGLALFGLVTAAMITGVAHAPLYNLFNGSFPPLVAGAIYFAVAACDDWRVRGRRFAERPTVLFRFDPLHIEYLEPL